MVDDGGLKPSDLRVIRVRVPFWAYRGASISGNMGRL
jgi:hypothetical protein